MRTFIPMAKDNPRGMHPKARAWVFNLDPHSLRPVDIQWLFGKEGTDEPTVKDLHDLRYKSLWVWNRQITISWDYALGNPDDERQQHRLLDIKALVRDDLSRVTQELSPYLRQNLIIRFELKGWNFHSWFVHGTDEISDSAELQALFKFGYKLPDPDRGPIDDRPAPPIT
jgi:hypothetical protein